MNEKKLLIASVLVSIIGILTLFIISFFIKPDAIRASQIDETMIGRTVIVEGDVASVNTNGNRTVIFIDNSDVAAVAFSGLDLQKGDKVKVTGVVEEYNGKLQIKADKIEVTT